MSGLSSIRRAAFRLFWRLVNPITRPLAGFAPWWVLLETTGNSTGRRRLTPLAAGPTDDGAMLLITVHGRGSAWVRNIEAQPSVRMRHRGRWRPASATVEAFDRELARRFSLYARMGPPLAGIDPLIVRISFSAGGGTT